MMDSVKKRLVEDYEKYVGYYNSKNIPVSSWRTKYISLVVYISDLFCDLYDDDIEDYTDVRIRD